MIVTRQRKKPFPWKRVLTPAVALSVVAAALWWPPSRAWISTGPLSPVWKPITVPLDVAARERMISAQNATIASLQKQLADARMQIGDRDKQLSQLQTQLTDVEQQAALAKAVKPAAKAAAPAPAADLSVQASPDMRRTAAVWSAMDAEAAAKVVQRLPQDYVARIFALMSPDSVGAILENVPASYAARLTQEHPELRR